MFTQKTQSLRGGELWSDLKNHNNSPIIRQHAWTVSGDFNEILDVEEHLMHEQRTTVSPGIHEFQSAVHHSNLLDITSHGPLFTWTNQREEGIISKTTGSCDG